MSADKNELAQQIRDRHWFHSIDLGGGLVTKGDSPSSAVIKAIMPDVRGKSVLDIGAWDGKYSYEAEAAGAARVVALDHYVWRLDGAARQAYYDECVKAGKLPEPAMIDSGFLMETGLPGKAGFDLIHDYLDSKVEAVVGDFTTMDLTELGQFDVVFYFGVLYHMVDPISALQRVRAVTKELAVIETAGIVMPGLETSSLVEFYAGDDLHADYGNWFAPSPRALESMCLAAGFAAVEPGKPGAVQKPGRRRMLSARKQPQRCRLTAIARP